MENYKAAFIEGRRFVLPMNPPRLELDRAVRLIFGEHGISLKRARLFDRGRIMAAEEEGEGGEPKKPHGDPGRSQRRRRRRRRNPESPGGNSPPTETT